MVLLVLGHSGTLVTVCLSPPCLSSNQLMLIYNRQRIIFKISFSYFFGRAAQLMGSYFANQGPDRCPGSESANS